MSRVLFILKRRQDFDAKVHTHVGLSTGLYNSAKFMNDMLLDHDIESYLEVVEDYNRIDKYVTQYRPTHVIIEAIWVVPQKFAVLQKLHPNVKWVIRVHSETPFLAGEGMAFDWLGDYSSFKNITLAINAPRMLEDIKIYLQHCNGWTNQQTDEKIIYLPNYYPQTYTSKTLDKNKETIEA